MAWPVQLTERESDRLREVLVNEVDTTDDKVVQWRLRMILSMMDREITLEPDDVDVVQATVQTILNRLPEGESDRYLEAAYFRLYGDWFRRPPWFEVELGIELPEDWDP